MDFKTKAIYLTFLRRRLEPIARFSEEPEMVQRAQLRYILGHMEGTDFAARYDLSHHLSYEQFAQRVPIQTYEDVKNDVNRMVQGERDVLLRGACRWYAKSSGTTNDKSKFIPVPYPYLQRNHYRGGTDVVTLYLHNHPESRMFGTKGLLLGGSHAPAAVNGNAHAGDLSAVLVQHMPPLGDFIRVPKRETLLMSEWISKLERIVEEVIPARVGSLSGVPSWMLVMIKRVLEKTGAKNLSEVWPDLEVFFHGGISFEPYRDTYRELIPSPRMHYMETYNASEGFFAIQDNPELHAMMLMLDYGVFFEFVPIEALDETATPICHPDDVRPIWEVELNKNYAMLITTSGGLYRYLIGDTIRFETDHPYRIVISGRTKSFINAFGEELMVGNTDKALAKVCRETGAKVRDYTAAPFFMTGSAKGRHDWIIEFEQRPEDLSAFARALDDELKQLNSDYEAKRYEDMTLLPLQITEAPEGLFHQWLQNRGKLGGQHKIIRLQNNRKMLDELLVMIDQYRG